EERADELAADVAGDVDRSTVDALPAYDDRRAIVVALADGLDAELLKGVEERPDRALAHPRHAIDPGSPAAHSDVRGEKTSGGPRVPNEQVGGGSRWWPPDSVDHDRRPTRIGLDRHVERAQRADHVVGVVAEQGLVNGRAPGGERRDQERPVGVAL